MYASIDEVKSAITDVGKKLGQVGLLRDQSDIDVQRLTHNTVRVTWRTSKIANLSDFPDSSIDEYLQFLEGRHYNYLLEDGALIQLSYDIRGKREITGCRTVWYPCPITFQPEDLEIAPLNEIVLTTPQRNISCRGPLRFDYAPRQVAQDHPETHMHAGLEAFRLPIQRAFEPSRFLRFIMRSAYPTLWREHIEVFTCEDWGAADSLTDDDKRIGYLGWKTSTNQGANAR